MAQFKGTPGPWHVSNENTLVIRDDEWLIPVATAGYVTNEEELATAYLIAAAPELLEALQGMLESCVWDVYGRPSPESRNAAEAAINKATGETK